MSILETISTFIANKTSYRVITSTITGILGQGPEKWKWMGEGNNTNSSLLFLVSGSTAMGERNIRDDGLTSSVVLELKGANHVTGILSKISIYVGNQ
jgi:hypothetical protein